MAKNPQRHIVTQAALVRISCSCGWRFHYDQSLKGKTDEELSKICLDEFNNHAEMK